jgi:hypothetical protein
MRAVIAVLASISFCGIPMPSFAQDLNDIINQLSVKARSEIARIARRAESEWNKLPQSERTCVNQKLSERGESVQSLARRAILPSDTRVSDLRSQCRALLASAAQDQPLAHTKPSPPSDDTPAVAQPTPAQRTPTQSAAAQSRPESRSLRARHPSLRQTNEKLKIDLKDSAIKIAELEKEKTELERALKGVIEETQIPDKRKLNAMLVQLEADKTETDDRAWKFFAYVAIGGLIVIPAVITSILLIRWKRAPLEFARNLRHEIVTVWVNAGRSGGGGLRSVAVCKDNV